MPYLKGIAPGLIEVIRGMFLLQGCVYYLLYRNCILRQFRKPIPANEEDVLKLRKLTFGTKVAEHLVVVKAAKLKAGHRSNSIREFEEVAYLSLPLCGHGVEMHQPSLLTSYP